MPMHPLILVLIAVLVGAAILGHRKVDGAWRAAARELGLSTVQMGRFGQRSMVGKRGGLDVVIDTGSQGSGNHSKTYTRLRVKFPRSDTGYRLTKQGPFSQVGRFFAGRDLELGDPEFDSAVLVRGQNADALRAHLTPRRRMVIQRFLSRNSECVIRDGEVELRAPDVVTSAALLDSMLDQLVRVAKVMAEDSDQTAEPEVDRALATQREGDLGGALEQVRSIEAGEPAQAVELGVLEGGILLAAGRKDEAREVLEGALDDHPDQEVEQLVELTRRPPAPAEPPPRVVELDVASVCAALFPSRSLSSETARVFAERYEGLTVRWRGTLERSSTYYSDLVFGNERGARATFAVHELHYDAYSSKRVQAVVQLPKEVEVELRGARGRELEFTGRLVRCDPFMRNLFLAEGRIVSD